MATYVLRTGDGNILLIDKGMFPNAKGEKENINVDIGEKQANQWAKGLLQLNRQEAKSTGSHITGHAEVN